MTQFQLWEPVLIFHNHLTTFPSTSTKILVRFVGFSDSVGNAGCYKVYNEATGQTLSRALLFRLGERGTIPSAQVGSQMIYPECC